MSDPEFKWTELHGSMPVSEEAAAFLSVYIDAQRDAMERDLAQAYYDGADTSSPPKRDPFRARVGTWVWENVIWKFFGRLCPPHWF